MSPIFRSALLAGALLFAPACAPKHAAGGGTSLTIQVFDEHDNPVSTATVRNPEEAERHEVNSVTGAWTASTLYLNGGQQVAFGPGMEVTFEITAPGYLSETVRYIMRKRKNLIAVHLSKMNMKDDLDKMQDPMITFGRDKPLDGKPASPPQQ